MTATLLSFLAMIGVILWAAYGITRLLIDKWRGKPVQLFSETDTLTQNTQNLQSVTNIINNL